MHVLLSEAIAAVVRASGLPALVRHTFGRRRAAILVYHDPQPEVLERHLRYLARRHAFCSLDTVVDAIRAGDWSAVPPRAVVLTFDDGHRGNAALEDLFRRYDVRPTIYLCSQVAGTRRRFWFHAAGDDRQALKRLPSAARRRELARRGFDPLREHDDARDALSREELSTLAPVADLASHTRLHPVLTTCDDAECEEEITRSRAEIEQLTARPCRHLSFPNGDHTERERRLARAAGYASARTIDLGLCDVRTDPFALRALVVPDDASVTRLAAALVPVGPTYVRRLLSGSLSGRHRPIVATEAG